MAASDPYDGFCKFFLPDEWAAMSGVQRYEIKIQFLDWLGATAKAGHEAEKTDWMKRYDIRRAKILAERHETLMKSKSGARRKKNKQPESDLPYQEVLKGFSELEISEAKAEQANSRLKSCIQRCLDEFDSSDSEISESNVYKKKYRLRRGKRVNYNEDKDEEKDFDEFIYCQHCDGHYLDFCPKHPYMVMPDDKVDEKVRLPGQTMAELSCPSKFLKIAPSRIPGAGLGVFTRCYLPMDVQFGPNKGVVVSKVGAEGYTWQTSETNKHKKQLVDSADPNKSNWLRYFNCARSRSEQNCTVFQYQGELYYRSTRNSPPGTELLIFYGMEYAKLLGIDMERYHLPLDMNQKHKGNKEKLSCEYCRRTFVLQQSLKVHQNICGKVSPSINAEDIHQHSELTIHMRTHTGDRPYVCDVCNKGFTQSGDLTKHMRIHTGDRPYVCDVCNKGFKLNGNLTTHMRIHTGDRPYVCDLCNKGFTNSSHLTVHMHTHTGDRPYVCDVCNKGFTQSGDLTKHMRIHTGDRPYVCDICNKGFTQSGELTIHMRTHTGDRPYVCDVCNKGFTQSGDLTKHMRIHTGDKPYLCEVCDKDFTTSSGLSYHIRHSCKSIKVHKNKK